MKQVFLDGSKLSTDIASGISNYIVNLFSQFKAVESQYDLRCTIGFLGEIPRANIFFRDHEEAGLSDFSITSYSGFAKTLIMGRPGYSLFHSPYMFLPPRTRDSINFLTIHDTINLERPFSVKSKLRERMLRLAIGRADYYICISNATKSNLLAHFPTVPEERIFVIHQGIDNIFFSQPASVDNSKSNRTPYLLYVGHRGGYKNFRALLEFLSESSSAQGLHAVCVGGGHFSKEELEAIAALRLTSRVSHAGYIGNQDLIALYRNAVALAYTSLHEGFGLPILEAMALGCPVICGNFSSMKEVSNGHAALVDDFSVDSMAEALLRVSRMDEVKINAAKSHAFSFTWNRTAASTLEAYAIALR